MLIHDLFALAVATHTHHATHHNVTTAVRIQHSPVRSHYHADALALLDARATHDGWP
jgi:hypothetical protein